VNFGNGRVRGSSDNLTVAGQMATTGTAFSGTPTCAANYAGCFTGNGSLTS
tara:strand:+ start:555 stop:707 length:153 start_codon:yes stop_codon:yes gene_type:complete